jgi:hypothetical protein
MALAAGATIRTATRHRQQRSRRSLVDLEAFMVILSEGVVIMFREIPS